MNSFAPVGGPGPLGSIWEKLKEMRVVIGRKRKDMESTNSQDQSDLTANGSSVSNTSMLRRQIDNIRLGSDSSNSSQGQSPVLVARQIIHESNPMPSTSNASIATGNAAAFGDRQGNLFFNRSFAERQPLPDSDQSMPGLASTESSSDSSSEEDNELAFSVRPWYRPEE